MSDRQKKVQADILIVDDTPANLRLLSQMLVDHGYGVRALTSGARALESVKIAPPDLVLLDIRMPEMDGYQVCERLKSDQNTCEIPVLFISALDDIQDKVKAFNVGGLDYITKPFQIEEVLARVETHLALRELQTQLQSVNKKFEHELLLAGQMQASFLPDELPDLPGWQIAARLQPARETSGDFFDVFMLPNGSLGLIVGDVCDKGVGAALFMVLSWSLLRTYAGEFPDQPERVCQAVDRRIMGDTASDQFVTVFFGVLDPATGELAYCNAGHNPPLIVNPQRLGDVKKLKATGTPLGILEDQTWEQGSVRLDPGDVLVLYTDGVPDAQSPQGGFFDGERLLDSIQSHLHEGSEAIRDGILSDVYHFMDGEPAYDDIALVVLVRDSSL